MNLSTAPHANTAPPVQQLLLVKRHPSRFKPQERAPKLNPGDILSFAVGLLAPVEIQLTGTLLCGDILFLLILIALVPKKGGRLLETQCAIIILLAGTWLASQVITDMLTNSYPEDYLRGWARIITFSVNFAGSYLLLRSERRITLYLVAICISLALKYVYQPVPDYALDPWKWAFGWPITVLLVILAGRFHRPSSPAVTFCLLLIACALNFYFNYRSEALFCFGTACCIALSSQKGRLSLVRIACAAVLLTAAMWVFSGIYSFLAGSGYLGDKAQAKYQDQTSGDMNILLAGRNESLASIQAIIDSPVIGHGSWAKDPHYGEIERSSLTEHGYKIRGKTPDLIPTHSHITGAWVEAGVLGILLWIFVFFLTIRGLIGLLSRNRPLKALSFFCALSLLWDIPFSPFGGTRPIITPIFIILMLNAIKPRWQGASSEIERENFQMRPMGVSQ